MLRRLRPTRRDLASVAAIDTDPETRALLRTAQHSQRLLLLRAVLDAATRHPAIPGPLPPPATAWDLLVRAEQRDRAAVRTVLCHPPVGIWAAYVLRRLRQPGIDPATLCGEVGHLHTIAVTAAIRAGLTFTHPVPLRDGAVVLPTLGMARFAGSGPWEVAEAGSGPDRSWITGPDGTVELGHGPRWSAMRRVRVAVHGHRWDVRLDDVDPYRGFDRPVAPDPLVEHEFEHWRAGLDRAWALLVAHHATAAEQLRTGLTVLIPQSPGDNPYRLPSGSCADGIGAAALGLPDDPVHLAATLVHELWHSKLNALLELVSLCRDDGAGRYAPWRDDPRPVGGLLHGCYAFVGVTEFWRRHALATREPLARFEFAIHAEQVRDVLGTLAGDAPLTEDGRYFVTELAAVAGDWQADTGMIGGRIAELAHRAVLDHQVTWRLRHLRPDPARVAALAEAWLRGEAAEPELLGEPELWPDTTGSGDPRARTNLTRLLVRDPVRFTRVVARPGTAARLVPGATEADVLLVAGDSMAAAATYRARIAEVPTDPVSWAGLALAVAAVDGGRLLARAEWVRAVYQRVVATGAVPDPAELAGWLAGAPLAASR